MKNFKFIYLTFIIIFLDQLTKYFVIIKMAYGQSIPLIGDLLRFTYARNTGASFSMSIGSPLLNRIIFSAIAFAAVVFMIFLIKQSKVKMEMIVLPIIMGGAIGNLIDRILYGYVIDFIDVDFPDFIMHRWPIFNVADSAINIGVTLYILYEIFKNKASNSEE